jgi:predicted TIM-barrel fold metal-dependent hydrolase
MQLLREYRDTYYNPLKEAVGDQWKGEGFIFVSDSGDKIGRVMHPDSVTGYAAIHPDHEDIQGLIRDVRTMGLKGLKIHPDMQRFALDSPKAMEMFAAIEGKMPIIIHTGDPRYEYSRPRQMKKVLDAFPKLVCVCAHLGGWSEWDEATRTLAEYENVYVDTSSSLYTLKPEEGRRIIRSYSRDRVLFGTDYPMWNPAEELERFHRLQLTDDEEEKILCLNAGTLLGC